MLITDVLTKFDLIALSGADEDQVHLSFEIPVKARIFPNPRATIHPNVLVWVLDPMLQVFVIKRDVALVPNDSAVVVVSSAGGGK